MLFDIHMPVMDGQEALRQIRAGAEGVRNPVLPVVVLTADAIESDREKFPQAGMDDYLVRPVECSILEAWLCQHLAGP